MADLSIALCKRVPKTMFHNHELLLAFFNFSPPLRKISEFLSGDQSFIPTKCPLSKLFGPQDVPGPRSPRCPGLIGADAVLLLPLDGPAQQDGEDEDGGLRHTM